MISTCRRHTGKNERTWRHKTKLQTFYRELTLPSQQRWISMRHFFASDSIFYHELSGNYKLCSIKGWRRQWVSERTSTAVCQRARGGWGGGVKWGLHDLRFVLSSTPGAKRISVCVCAGLFSLFCVFLTGLLATSLHESSTLLPPASFITAPATRACEWVSSGYPTRRPYGATGNALDTYKNKQHQLDLHQKLQATSLALLLIILLSNFSHRVLYCLPVNSFISLFVARQLRWELGLGCPMAFRCQT